MRHLDKGRGSTRQTQGGKGLPGRPRIPDMICTHLALGKPVPELWAAAGEETGALCGQEGLPWAAEHGTRKSETHIRGTVGAGL